jgi:hypothetical protein
MIGGRNVAENVPVVNAGSVEITSQAENNHRLTGLSVWRNIVAPSRLRRATEWIDSVSTDPQGPLELAWLAK